MFDFLKGGKTDLTITVDRPTAFYLPGDCVKAKLRIESQNEAKIQEGRIVLLYKEEYERRYEDWHRDSKGHRTRRQVTSWHSQDHEVERKVFVQEGTIPANYDQTSEFEFSLPPLAPPTADGGKIVRLKWLVKATLDRKMSSDFNAQAEILVGAAPGQARGAGVYGSSNEPGEAEMALALPSDTFVLGDTIEGELIIRPQKSFDVTEIRVELERAERVPRDLGNEHFERTGVKLAAGAKLQTGQETRLPFRLQVPTPRPPTSHADNYVVEWSLKGILARRMRPDTLVQERIAIFSTRPR